MSEITNFQSITYHNDNKLDVYNPVTVKKVGSVHKRKSDTFGMKLQSNNFTGSTNSFRFSPCNQNFVGNALSERP